MNWRTWMYQTVKEALSDPEVKVFGSGSLPDTPKVRPFVIITMSTNTRDAAVASQQEVTVWVHDEPGGYTRIDNIITTIRNSVEGPVTEEGGVFAHWTGDSDDLSDDGRGTIVRTSTYILAGRR